MTESKITVILTNYRRPQNVERILESLRKQCISYQLFVLDNSPDQSYRWEADWLLRSIPSSPPAPRWWMASQADTEYVVCMDDDLAFADERVLGDTVSTLQKYPSTGVGATGVQLQDGCGYRKGRHLGLENEPISQDMPVDIIKGRYFAVPTELLRKLPVLPLECEDDIIVSSAIENKVVPKVLQGRFLELPTGEESRWHRNEHWSARETTTCSYFPMTSGSPSQTDSIGSE